MAEARIIEKPQRWDVPFSRELHDPNQRRDMTERDIDDLLKIKPFSEMKQDNFPKRWSLRGILKNDTRICKYRNGEVIVRSGDYGSSAFLILTGSVRAILKGLDPKILGRRERQQKTWFSSLVQLFTNPKSPESRRAELYPQMPERRDQPQADRKWVFVQDIPNVLEVFPEAFEKTENEQMVDAEQYQRLAEAGEVPESMLGGQLFGELAALGRIPRSATVVADGDAELLEIRWQGLRDLRKYDKTLRQHVDEQFRKYGLRATLLASPLLAHLFPPESAPQGVKKKLKNALTEIFKVAEFETYGEFEWYGTYQELRKKEVDPLLNEPIISAEGHYPNGLILIRAGFARLSRKRGHGEHTFSYLGKGDIYGLAELAHNARNKQQVPFSATLRAIGYVDVVRIPTRTFEQLILPSIPPGMIPDLPTAVSHAQPDDAPKVSLPLAPSARAPISSPHAELLDPAMVEFLVEDRFINGTSTMMIDLDRCTRCDECVRACASGHSNNPRFIRHGKVFGHHMVANACMHCVDPVCMIGCPTGAIHRSEEGGQVVINDITCIGCGMCAASCPYDNIRMVDVRDRSSNDAIMIDPKNKRPIVKATKCDLCVDHHGGPACERACPHDALKRVDMSDVESLAKWLNR